jgi:hypothetical protein
MFPKQMNRILVMAAKIRKFSAATDAFDNQPITVVDPPEKQGDQLA